MLYAASEGGAKIRAEPDAVGFCPGCGEMLVPRCGEVNIWHWAHQAGRDCDDWYEPETAWHLWWKELAPAEHREVVVGQHRADVLGSRGVVVELQHSSISPETIAEREAFYEKMVWIVDAADFADRLSFKLWIDEINDEKEFSYCWSHQRRSWKSASAPLFFDLGNTGIQIERRRTYWGRMNHTPPRHGHITEDLGGICVDMSRWLLWVKEIPDYFDDPCEASVVSKGLVVEKYFI